MSDPKHHDDASAPAAPSHPSQEERDKAFVEHLKSLGAVETELDDDDDDDFWLETIGGKPRKSEPDAEE